MSHLAVTNECFKHCFDPEYADSSEVKFEELKNVKLEEEEPDAAVLDLSISHSVTSALTQSAMKQSSASSSQSGSSMCSSSSDSESPDFPRQALEQAEVLTVHSYAKEEVGGMDSEQPSGKKASATTHVNEQELAKVIGRLVLGLHYKSSLAVAYAASRLMISDT